MAGKAVISLTTGLEDPEKVTVAFLVAVGAAEAGRPTLMFQAKEAVRLALAGVATGVACDGCPPLLLVESVQHRALIEHASEHNQADRHRPVRRAGHVLSRRGPGIRRS